jgi:hypothetical protein
MYTNTGILKLKISQISRSESKYHAMCFLDTIADEFGRCNLIELIINDFLKNFFSLNNSNLS